MIELTRETLFENIDFDLFSTDGESTIEFSINDFEISIFYKIKYYENNVINFLDTDIGCVLDGVELPITNKTDLEILLEEEIYNLYHK